MSASDSPPDSGIVTRFAPSPTGMLHIGNARTALFNWLFARGRGGKFLLRVEDTDRARSTPEAIQAIFDGLDWLGLDYDGEPYFQSKRADGHVEAARQLLAEGKAYYCYCSQQELAEMRETAKSEGRPMRYDGRWRDRNPSEAPAGVDPVIRFKAPLEGETRIDDLIQGPVTVSHEQLDDMVLVRADGSPTYMLSVVVDDHDMGVTHVIRGDDHLTNAFRQTQLYLSLGWTAPKFGHMPLIHGPDGAKLSKRHGALAVSAYREMGYLPEAMRNYLLRLGWGHGDDEIISTEQALEWFSLDAVGRSPARFDFTKLDNLNGHYIRQADDDRLVELTVPFMLTALDQSTPDPVGLERVHRIMPELKPRAKTLVELADNGKFCFAARPLTLDDSANKVLTKDARKLLVDVSDSLAATADWTAPALESAVRAYAEKAGLGLGKVAQPLRAALTGRTTSPGIFDVLLVLGREESLARIRDQAV
ncbi:MAG TPA: glutamate--tRNA ligase [Alphaproteobacteria bacterium]|nr:glutamate--tRNA ligase [Alphaproteobacteria bacterium]